jgi:hypothetical protein
MKNMKRWGGILALTLIFGLFLTGCPTGSTDSGGPSAPPGSNVNQTRFDGNWTKGNYTMTFNKGEWTLKNGTTNVAKGTFGLYESTATGSLTHRWVGNAWQSDPVPGLCSYTFTATTLTISSNLLPNEITGTWTKS